MYKKVIKKIFILIIINLFISNVSISKEKQNYKLNFNSDSLFLKGRDIKETVKLIKKNDIEFSFVNYNEKNSFLEITLRTVNNDQQYFSLSNMIDLISNKRLSFMNNLDVEKLSEIKTFLDQKTKRFFYYRSFDNKKLKNEKCVIFVAGTKKNSNNTYIQAVNGVGCSTEIKLSHNNIGKILSLIEIKKNN